MTLDLRPLAPRCPPQQPQCAVPAQRSSERYVLDMHDANEAEPLWPALSSGYDLALKPVPGCKKHFCLRAIYSAPLSLSLRKI
eukprot:6197534-Pleurochrysis_carterae.AAC.1